MIAMGLQDVEEKIIQACKKAGRSRDEITLVAVTKTQPQSVIMEAYEAGVRDFGENKVQELVEKVEPLPDDITWHMIGHLQRNKVRQVVGRAKLIHSVDSLRLAEAIDKESSKQGVISDILLEVNVSEEDSKFGLKINETIPLIEKISNFKHISVKGLMTMAPFTDNPESNREFFIDLRKLSVDIEREKIDNITMGVLSMGMTNDYQIAIEEGATIIRVGTGIFGARFFG
jgi:pyridoxal phosphate enzyme (YggS family)